MEGVRFACGNAWPCDCDFPSKFILFLRLLILSFISLFFPICSLSLVFTISIFLTSSFFSTCNSSFIYSYLEEDLDGDFWGEQLEGGYCMLVELLIRTEYTLFSVSFEDPIPEANFSVPVSF